MGERYFRKGRKNLFEKPIVSGRFERGRSEGKIYV